jgi:hypothetical protein
MPLWLPASREQTQRTGQRQPPRNPAGADQNQRLEHILVLGRKRGPQLGQEVLLPHHIDSDPQARRRQSTNQQTDGGGPN